MLFGWCSPKFVYSSAVVVKKAVVNDFLFKFFFLFISYLFMSVTLDLGSVGFSGA